MYCLTSSTYWLVYDDMVQSWSESRQLHSIQFRSHDHTSVSMKQFQVAVVETQPLVGESTSL